MGMDLRAPKQRFATLMEDIAPTVTSQFVVWLDEKVSEFKVNGSMNFDINIDAPRWIRDYSMSVMLSNASQQYTPDKESESSYGHPSERPTSTARRKDPGPHVRRRPGIPSPSPLRSFPGAETSRVTMPQFSDEHTDRGFKRLHEDVDNSSTVVQREQEFIVVKRERHDADNELDRSINGSGDVTSSELVKSEPLSPGQPSYESADIHFASNTLRDNTNIDQSEDHSEPVQTIFTSGASQLVATAASTSGSIQGASGDDSFQEAILLDDSDDSREGNPDDFMRKIIAYESQHNPDDSAMLEESIEEDVAGTSGQGSDMLLAKSFSTGILDPEEAMQMDVIEVYPGTRVYWTKAHRDGVILNNSQPEHILSKCLDVFFTREVLKRSSARGMGRYLALDENIINACLCYVKQLYVISERRLIKVINNKCSQLRRAYIPRRREEKGGS